MKRANTAGMKTVTLGVVGLLWIALAATPAASCVGDCNEDRVVTVDEIARGVSMALGRPPAVSCEAFRSLAGTTDVDMLTAAVNDALVGCPSYLDLAELDEARARWQAQGLASYSMRYVRSCFCLPPAEVEVVVRDGVIESVTDPSTGAAVPFDGQGLWRALAVDDLFDALEEALASADDASVEYDAERGFPSRASFDFIRGAADDELSISITALEAIDPD